MASTVNALAGTSASATASGASSGGLGSTAPTEQVFLQLLVSQIKNQDPLNPTDSTQFVSQLAQFSELEQVIAIRSDLDNSAATSTAAGSSSGNIPVSNSAGSSGTTQGTTQGTSV